MASQSQTSDADHGAYLSGVLARPGATEPHRGPLTRREVAREGPLARTGVPWPAWRRWDT
jgi:hypothetical protein